MTDEPLVSICIPTYNRAGMIGSAIESALGQSYRNVEVIVVDNASTDSTEEVVRKFKDNRLHFHRNSTNLGLFGNFNKCVELASGEFIHILHSDDYIDSDFTITCIRFFLDHPHVDLTFTSVTIQAGNKETDLSFSDKNEIFIAPEGFRRILTNRSFIICPSVMMKRSVYERQGNYSLEFPYSSDLNQWLKITRVHDIGFVRNARVYYRQGEHSESYHLLFTNATGYLDTLKIYSQLIQSLGKESSSYNTELNIMFRRFALDCLYAGFTRIDTMTGFKPSFFSGTAISSWSMIRSVSIRDFITKWALLFILLSAGCIMVITPLRLLFKKLLLMKSIKY